MLLLVLASVGVVSALSLVGVFFLSVGEEWLKRVLFFLVAVAIGALLGDALLHLIPEAFESALEPASISLLIIAGIISFFILEKALRWHHHHYEAAEDAVAHDLPDAAPHHIGRLVIISDAFHNFLDGIIIAASYLVSVEVGVATTLAVMLHELPQEIGDFGVLIYAGYSRKRALTLNLLSALTAFAGAVLVITFRAIPDVFIASILPFAAGSFLYIACSDLVPELHRKRPGNFAWELIGMGIGIGAMYLLLFLE